MTLRYGFDFDCPRCPGPVVHQAGGTSTGLATRAVVHCRGCKDDWVIEVRIIRSEHTARQADRIGSNLVKQVAI